jgi:hypothetical protein
MAAEAKGAHARARERRVRIGRGEGRRMIEAGASDPFGWNTVI